MNTKPLLKKEVPVQVQVREVIDPRVIRARVTAMKRARARYIASFSK